MKTNINFLTHATNVENEFKDDRHRKWHNIGWREPEIGRAKLNTDEAAKGNLGLAGAGGLLRDGSGIRLEDLFILLVSLRQFMRNDGRLRMGWN